MLKSGLRWAGPPLFTLFLGALVTLAFRYFVSLVGGNITLRLHLVILAVTGALGGVVYSLIGNRGAVRWAWPDEKESVLLQCGTLADAIVGVGGAWGIFLVLGRSMKPVDKVEDTEGVLVLIGLGVVAGFAARSLLHLLARRLQEMIGEKEVQETARKETRKTGLPTIFSHAKTVVEIFDRADEQARASLRVVLEDALRATEAALTSWPDETSLYGVFGAIKKRLALIRPEARRALLDEAISACSKALELDSGLAWAYYNRACYKALNRIGADAILPDIRKAIELNPDFKQRFLRDSDLEDYREHEEIRAVLSGS